MCSLSCIHHHLKLRQIWSLCHFLQVVGFVPTGWMYEMKRSTFPTRSKGPCTVHLVPYSEHSSYEELREYVRFLKPHQVRGWLGVGFRSGVFSSRKFFLPADQHWASSLMADDIPLMLMHTSISHLPLAISQFINRSAHCVVRPVAVLMQVIPTVGVSGDGAEGEKKVATQLKHFRNLVDENASKVRFESHWRLMIEVRLRLRLRTLVPLFPWNSRCCMCTRWAERLRSLKSVS